MEKLGDQDFNMLLVGLLDVYTLSVHRLHIVLILVTQLIHPLDQVISLVGQICQLLIHCDFLLAVFHLSVPQVVKLVVQLPQTVVSGVVV